MTLPTFYHINHLQHFYLTFTFSVLSVLIVADCVLFSL